MGRMRHQRTSFGQQGWKTAFLFTPARTDRRKPQLSTGTACFFRCCGRRSRRRGYDRARAWVISGAGLQIKWIQFGMGTVCQVSRRVLHRPNQAHVQSSSSFGATLPSKTSSSKSSINGIMSKSGPPLNNLAYRWRKQLAPVWQRHKRVWGNAAPRSKSAVS
jgi:hypothetical protein